MSVRNINSENFIESLDLPAGVQAKHFEGMNRYHFKYYGDGFLIVDLRKDYYHLRTREQYLRGVGVLDFSPDKNHSPNSAAIKNIPYSNTDVFYRLVNYITHRKTYIPSEQTGINTPLKFINRLRKADGSVLYICGRCGGSFMKAPRCPECGQLVKE